MLNYSQGYCQAAMARQDLIIHGSANISLNANGDSPDTIVSSNTVVTDFLALGFCPGDKIYIKGALNAANDVAAVCTAVTQTTITLPPGTFAEAQAEGTATTYICATKGGSTKDILQGGTLTVFKSTKRATPDAASSESDVLITFNDVVFGDVAWDPVDKYAYIDLLAAVNSVASAGGTGIWWCLSAKGEDIHSASTSAVRIDGTLGWNGDLYAPVTNIVSGAPQAISSFKLRFFQQKVG